MKKSILVFSISMLFLALVLTACGGGGEDGGSSSSGGSQNQSPCQLEPCTNLDQAQQVVINAERKTGSFLGGETYAVKFDAIVGNEYKVHVNSNVSANVYITDVNPLIPSKALENHWNIGHSAYDFQAKNSRPHYVVIKLDKSNEKVEASIWVTSRKENLTPLEKTLPIAINNIRTEFSLIPDALTRWSFDVKKGKTYSVYGDDTKGSIRIHTSIIPSVDTYEYDESQLLSGTITFQAKEDQKMYIAAVDRGEGSDGHIRVYSYDEPIVPLGGENVISLNATPAQFDINPHKYVRFTFNTVPGKDYTVLVKEVTGDVGAWLSKIPSVDGHVYEKGSSYCDCNFTWREATSTRWFMAVGNNSTTTGAKFTVQVTEK